MRKSVFIFTKRILQSTHLGCLLSVSINNTHGVYMISIYRLLIIFSILTIQSFLITGCGGDGDSPPPRFIVKPGFYFSFDGTGTVIEDNSGNGHDANPTSISRVTGKVGSAIQFLSLGSVLEISEPDSAFPQNEILTVMAWVKTDHEYTQREQIIGGWTGGAPGSFYPINNFGVSLVDNRLSFEVSSYPNMVSLTSNQLPIILNEWFHIAVTYNGDTLKFYYNGQLVNQGSILTTFDSSFSNQIGHNFNSWGGKQIFDQFYGYLDELYVDTRVYTDAEILDYYNNTN